MEQYIWEVPTFPLQQGKGCMMGFCAWDVGHTEKARGEPYHFKPVQEGREGRKHLQPAYLGTDDILPWNEDSSVHLCNKDVLSAYAGPGIVQHLGFSSVQNTSKYLSSQSWQFYGLISRFMLSLKVSIGLSLPKKSRKFRQI